MSVSTQELNVMQERLEKGRNAKNKIALDTLDQIAGQPSNTLSRRLAKSTLTFLGTTNAAPIAFEIKPSNDEAKLNKTERARLAHLRALGMSPVGIQDITLKLGDDCRFTPDFHYFTPSGQMYFEDVKGFQRDDALVKIKTAARMFSWATFLIVKKTKGGWEIKEIKP